jgi:2-iminoacetate synthase
MMRDSGIDRSEIRDILSKSLSLEVLDLREVDTLLSVEDRDTWDEIFDASRKVKEKVYGNRIVLFAPLYLSNECTNDCQYCGFRRGNKEARRKTLTIEEAVQEADFLSKKGYKRILLVASEHPKKAGIDYLEQVIDAIYKNTDIRIIHVNAAPMSVEEFRRLKAAGVGVYQCFQETYHYPTYRQMHPSGKKADYEWRIEVMDRAIEGGFEDVGMGVLLGLYNWQWDVIAMVSHAKRLMQKYGFGPHTISVPRLQPAQGARVDLNKHRISDEDLKKIVAVYRLSLPYVGIVISTREPAWLRDELITIGASQISAGSRTSPGGYLHEGDTEQFEIGDTRALDEVIMAIAEKGLVPSLCTACYREGRSGERFRHLAETSRIKNFCHGNALLSLKEYIEDYAPPEVRERLERLIEHEITKSRNGIVERLRLIEAGKRDVHV